MDNKHQPRRWPPVLRPSLVSLGIVVGTAIIWTGLYLALPSSLGAEVSLGGFMFLIYPLLHAYLVWGWGSWRAEVALWVTALLSILGTIGLEASVCSILANTALFSPDGATRVQCSVNHLQAGWFGHAFGGLVITLMLWLGLRYQNAQMRRK